MISIEKLSYDLAIYRWVWNSYDAYTPPFPYELLKSFTEK